MPKFPKPWFRKDRKAWFVQLHGKQVNLGPNRNDALNKYHELMSKPLQQRAEPTAVVTILDQFLDWTSKHRAPRTYRWYLDRCQGFADSLPPGLQINNLRPFHVQAWVDANVKWASGMKRGCIVAVLRALNWAEKMGLIDRTPIRSMEKPPAGKRTQIISATVYRQILTTTKNADFRDLLVAAWETGARPQELTHVEARHVDVENARWVFPPHEAKIKSRPRIVYLSEAVLEITKKRMLQNPNGPIFRNSRGNPWHPYAVNCCFQRIKAKIGQRFCLYVFRHSFATRSLEAGVDPLTVAILLGHANPAMLSTTYQHLSLNPQHLLAQAKRAGGEPLTSR